MRFSGCTGSRLIATAAMLLVLGLGAGDVHAQGAKGKYPLAVRGGPAQQNTIRVDTSTTPQRTEVGCETDQENTTTVNCLRIGGAAAGSPPTISAIAATGGDANIGITLTPLGTGTVVLGGNVTTTTLFLPAMEFCKSDAAAGTLQSSLIPVRAATGDWSMQRTSAGAETINVHCSLNFLGQRSTALKGIRVDSFSIVQQITVAALTSNTFNGFNQTVYANNVADAVTNCCGTITITMPTATQANPYVTAATVGTPVFQTTASAAWGLDWTVVLQNTGVYSLKGVVVTYTMALY